MTSEEIKRSGEGGAASGTLMVSAKRRPGKTRITVMDYDGRLSRERGRLGRRMLPSKTTLDRDLDQRRRRPRRLGHREARGVLRDPPLVLEDIMTTTQRPKTEDLGTAVYVVLRMIEFDEQGGGTSADQLSLILGPNYVLSFQETPGDCFDSVRERIRGGKGRIRELGPDYLAYALIDAVVDNYFFVLEKLGERIDGLEEQLIAEPRRELLREIHALKREMIELRKSVWPLRRSSAASERSESLSSRETNRPFSQGRLRPRHPGHRHDRVLPGDAVQHGRNLPLEPLQPHERDREGPDDHLHDLHPDHVSRRPLRDELLHSRRSDGVGATRSSGS